MINLGQTSCFQCINDLSDMEKVCCTGKVSGRLGLLNWKFLCRHLLWQRLAIQVPQKSLLWNTYHFSLLKCAESSLKKLPPFPFFNWDRICAVVPFYTDLLDWTNVIKGGLFQYVINPDVWNWISVSLRTIKESCFCRVYSWRIMFLLRWFHGIMFPK